MDEWFRPIPIAMCAAFLVWLGGCLILLPAIASKSGLSLRQHSFAALLLFTGALALRLLLPPMAPFHENEHGYQMLAHQELTYHNLTVLYPVVLRLFHLQLEGVFFFNLVLSSLTVPLVAAVARHLFEDDLAGWFAGLAAAFLPLAVRLAPTECFFNLAGFLLFMGLWIGLSSMRTSWLPGLYLGGLSAGLACLVRDLAVFIAPVYLLVLVAASERIPKRRELAPLLLPLAIAGMQALQILVIFEASKHGGMINRPISPEFLMGLGLHFDAVPAAFQVATLVGLVLGMRRPRRGIPVAIAIAVLNFGASIMWETPGIFRHGLVATLAWALPAADIATVACRLAMRWFTGRAGRIPVVAASMVVLAGFVPSLDFVVHRYPSNYEYEFLDRTIDSLPDSADFVVFDDPMVGSATSSRWFWVQKPNWRRIGWSKLSGKGADDMPTVFFLDIPCSTHVPGEQPVQTRYGPLRPACASALNARQWRDLGRIDLVGESYMGYHVTLFRDPVLVWLIDD